MNQFTVENTRKLFAAKIDAENLEREHRRVCRREGQRLLAQNPIPRWFGGTREEWEVLIRNNFGDCI